MATQGDGIATRPWFVPPGGSPRMGGRPPTERRRRPPLNGGCDSQHVLSNAFPSPITDAFFGPEDTRNPPRSGVGRRGGNGRIRRKHPTRETGRASRDRASASSPAADGKGNLRRRPNAMGSRPAMDRRPPDHLPPPAAAVDEPRRSLRGRLPKLPGGWQCQLISFCGDDRGQHGRRAQDQRHTEANDLR